MPQPVKLSDALISAARETAPLAHRSLAAQVEHWASLGRAIEGSLTAGQAAALKQAVQGSAPVVSGKAAAQSLADALGAALRPEWGAGVREALAQSPHPVYGTDKAFPGYLVRRETDGKLTPGRVVNRQFVPVTAVGATARPKAAARKRRA